MELEYLKYKQISSIFKEYTLEKFLYKENSSKFFESITIYLFYNENNSDKELEIIKNFVGLTFVNFFFKQLIYKECFFQFVLKKEKENFFFFNYIWTIINDSRVSVKYLTTQSKLSIEIKDINIFKQIMPISIRRLLGLVRIDIQFKNIKNREFFYSFLTFNIKK